MTGAHAVPGGTAIRHRGRRLPSWLLVVPGCALLIFAYLMPMLWVIRMAFNRFTGGGQIENTFTLATFAGIVSDPYYFKVAGRTVEVGVLVAIPTVVVAYPVALFLTRLQSRHRGILTALAIVPMMVSSVTRTYGWMVILGNQGLLTSLLHLFGVAQPPVLANSVSGVVVAMVQIFLPYAVLSMVSGFGRLDPRVEEAASSLGAPGWVRFWRVTVPLTAPGLITAVVLVFVMSISSYVTPRLIGGGRVYVLASEIYDQATNELNWPLAAALSVVLIILFGIAVTLAQIVQRRVERWVSGL